MSLPVSFTQEVKDDMVRVHPEPPSLRRLELAGLVRTLGILHISRAGRSLRLETDHGAVFRKARRYIKELYGLPTGITVSRPPAPRPPAAGSRYSLELSGEAALHVLRDLDIVDAGGRPRLSGVPSLPRSLEGRAALLRGMFLGAGHAGPPLKGYHLEWFFPHAGTARLCARLLAGLGVQGGVVTRRRGHAVYVKDGDQVARLLGLMGAHHSVLKFEQARVVRDMRGHLNRLVNAEAANLGKAAIAANRQVDAIRRLAAHRGLEELPLGLRQVAEARLAHPELSLRDLGAAMEPPLSKSAVAHRMRRLQVLARMLMGKGFSSQSSE